MLYGAIRHGYLGKTRVKWSNPARCGNRPDPGEVWAPARCDTAGQCAPGPGGAEKAKAKVGSGLAPNGRAQGLRRGAAPVERTESRLGPLPSRNSVRGCPRCRTSGSAAERLWKDIICSLESGFSRGSLRLSGPTMTCTFLPGPLSCKGVVFCHLLLGQRIIPAVTCYSDWAT